MKIKILEIVGNYNYDCYCEDIIKGITDWEEVTDKQYKKLREWVTAKNKKNVQYIIACQSDFRAMQAIADIEKLIDEEKAAANKRKESALKAVKTRAANKKKRKEEEERAELERLKRLYEAEVKGFPGPYDS